MILIDQVADTKLMATLERLKSASESARCIYFNLKTHTLPTGFKETLLAAVAKHLADANLQLFLCEDGDIFILAPTLATKNGRELMLDIGTTLQKPVSDDWVMFIDLPLHINKLLVEVDAKLEKRRKLAEAEERKREQEKTTRKRQSILNGATTSAQTDIKTIRLSRNQPELMMIEDDVFSSRLVENVLQKKFSLKTLASADNALTTYARLAPDLLFLDINLPDVTGHELLEKIMALDPEAYVVMLSGNADKENITHAMRLGAKGFIAKPFTREKLFQYIERCPTIKS